MVKVLSFLALILLSLLPGEIVFGQDHPHFDLERSLRMDFILTGEKEVQHAGLLRLKEENNWSGTTKSMIWPFDYGTYKIEIFDTANQLIFSQGFSTLFEEWQITGLPGKGSASFEQSYNIPYPKINVVVKLSVRNDHEFEKVADWEIDPANDNIIKDRPKQEAILIMGDENYRDNLDLVFLAEGYKESDARKARKDAKRFARFLFRNPPFDQYRKDINIWLVHVPSIDRGTDEPCKGIYRNTPLGSSFNTLELKRYLSVQEFFDVKDVAAAAPYDFILVMVNTERYGGGGVFNHFSVFSSNGYSAEKVFLHEFGHHFAGLADEYFNSEVTYEDMLDTSLEPWQPNITTLIDFDRKWADLLTEGVPVPTPRNKQFVGKTGVFEGGAYVRKGVYSPAMDCRMRTNKAKSFCEVCQSAIEKMLQLYITE